MRKMMTPARQQYMLVRMARLIVWLWIALFHIGLVFIAIAMMWFFQITPADVVAWLHATQEKTLYTLAGILGASVWTLVVLWRLVLRKVHARYGRDAIWSALNDGMPERSQK